MVKDIQTATKMLPTLYSQAAQIYGYIGRVDEEQGKRMLVILIDLLNNADANLKPVALMSIKNIGEKYKALLEPYIDTLRPLTESTPDPPFTLSPPCSPAPPRRLQRHRVALRQGHYRLLGEPRSRVRFVSAAKAVCANTAVTGRSTSAWTSRRRWWPTLRNTCRRTWKR